MSELVELNEYISYLPSQKEPLSCDVVFIRHKDCYWIYDVGCSKESSDAVNAIMRPRKVVLSHFHPDHVWNLIRTSYRELYVSENTMHHIKQGTLVAEDLIVPASGKCPEMRIFDFPSSHAKGCLALLCGEYLFVGDAVYAAEKKHAHFYNVQLLKQAIELLENLDCEFVCLSHARKFVQRKEVVLELLRGIFDRREKGRNEISVEEFFEDDEDED